MRYVNLRQIILVAVWTKNGFYLSSIQLNYIPIHTLSQWAKSSADADENPCSDVKLESELENGSIEDIPTELSPAVYHPKNALRISILSWLKYINADGKFVFYKTRAY